MMPVIPPRSNRKEPADYDRHRYRERHLVECFINKIKHYRRIFSRFEKLDTRYLGFLHFTAALILATVKCQHNLVSEPAFVGRHSTHWQYHRRTDLATAGLGDLYDGSRELERRIDYFPSNHLW